MSLPQLGPEGVLPCCFAFAGECVSSPPPLLFSCQSSEEPFCSTVLGRWRGRPLAVGPLRDKKKKKTWSHHLISPKLQTLSLGLLRQPVSCLALIGSLTVFVRPPATVSVVQRRPTHRIIYTSPFSLLIFTSAIISPLHPRLKMICWS